MSLGYSRAVSGPIFEAGTQALEVGMPTIMTYKGKGCQIPRDIPYEPDN